jgi:hypothetical protein
VTPANSRASGAGSLATTPDHATPPCCPRTDAVATAPLAVFPPSPRIPCCLIHRRMCAEAEEKFVFPTAAPFFAERSQRLSPRRCTAQRRPALTSASSDVVTVARAPCTSWSGPASPSSSHRDKEHPGVAVPSLRPPRGTACRWQLSYGRVHPWFHLPELTIGAAPPYEPVNAAGEHSSAPLTPIPTGRSTLPWRAPCGEPIPPQTPQTGSPPRRHPLSASPRCLDVGNGWAAAGQAHSGGAPCHLCFHLGLPALTEPAQVVGPAPCRPIVHSTISPFPLE